MDYEERLALFLEEHNVLNKLDLSTHGSPIRPAQYLIDQLPWVESEIDYRLMIETLTEQIDPEIITQLTIDRMQDIDSYVQYWIDKIDMPADPQAELAKTLMKIEMCYVLIGDQMINDQRI